MVANKPIPGAACAFSYHKELGRLRVVEQPYTYHTSALHWLALS